MRIRQSLMVVGLLSVLMGGAATWIFADAYTRVAQLVELRQVTSELGFGGFRLALLTGDLLLHDEIRSAKQWRNTASKLRHSIDTHQQLLAPYLPQVRNITERLDELESLSDRLRARIGKLASEGQSVRNDDVAELLTSQISIRITELQSALEEFDASVQFSVQRLLVGSHDGIVLKIVGWFILLVLLVALALRGFMARIMTPLTNLGAVITTLSSKDMEDMAARAKKVADDEIGAVIDAFNDLLDRQQTLFAAQEQAHLALVEAKTAAESATRAKSQFVANMSHEIRTPMNAVLGLLQLLHNTELTRRQADYVGKAEGAAKTLLGVINDILDFSKMEAGKLSIDPQPFHFDRLLRDLAVVLSAAVHHKQVEVLFDLDPAIPHILRGDAPRLLQVLLNLASNGIKFTEQGEVVVRLRALDIQPDHVQIRFSVHDTGIGIAPDHVQNLFKAFTQAETSTSRRFGGTGLGLIISLRLVRLMGGEIEVESTPGVGSTFAFTLDLARDEATRAAETQAHDNLTLAKQAKQAKPMRVLIVDDNATARSVLGSMVDALGWQVETAASGAAALERLLCQDQPAFDVVFVDWVMPELDGWETVQRIRALPEAPTLPVVIMVTAHGRELLAERLAGGENPLDGYLVKPVTPSMLFDAVADATAGTSVSTTLRLPVPSGRQRLAGLHLLLVEDNLLNQQVARELLTQEGAHVDVAGDGQQGVERVKLADPPYHAVLMDIQMPGIDGYEATRILREELRLTRLPIIAMTANALPIDRENCLAAGMNDHIGKPFHLDQIVSVLRQHCPQLADQATPDQAISDQAPEQGTVAATDDLPLADGFDFATALVRVGNNRQVLADVMRSFVAEQTAVAQQVRTALQAGQQKEAAQLLHTLKGLAGTVGAVALSRHAAELELRHKAGEGIDALAPALAALHNVLADAVGLLGTTADQLAPALATVAAVDSGPLDVARARHLLGELRGLLDDSNMRALDVHADLRRECAALGDRLTGLNRAITQLDYTAACTEVASLLQEIDA